MKHKVYLSHFGKVKSGKGVKIGVVRYIKATKNDFTKLKPPPDPYEGVGMWLSDLSPSPKLLSRYKCGLITWGEFKEEFIKESKEPNFIRGLTYILRILKESDVTLYCYCNNKDKHCHRFVLGQLLSNLGYEVEEL